MRKKMLAAAAFAALLVLPLEAFAQRRSTVTGAAVGGVAGAVVGGPVGAAVGAGAGAVVGSRYGGRRVKAYRGHRAHHARRAVRRY